MNRTRILVASAGLAFHCLTAVSAETAPADGKTPACPLVFINSTFEYASPLF